MFFKHKQVYGPSNKYSDIINKSVCFKYNGRAIMATDFIPIKILNNRTCCLPNRKDLLMNLSTENKGLMDTVGGCSDLSNTVYGESLIEKVSLEDNSLLIKNTHTRNISFNGLDSFFNLYNGLSSYTVTCKLKNFRPNKNYGFEIFSTAGALNIYCCAIPLFKNKNEITILHRVSDRTDIPPTETTVPVNTDGYFNLTFTYDDTTEMYRLYFNASEIFSLRMTKINGNSMHFDKQSICILKTYDLLNIGFSGIPTFNHTNTPTSELLVRGARIYNSVLSPNDIKAIMRYDGII